MDMPIDPPSPSYYAPQAEKQKQQAKMDEVLVEQVHELSGKLKQAEENCTLLMKDLENR
jgi:hypothetical protein